MTYNEFSGTLNPIHSLLYILKLTEVLHVIPVHCRYYEDFKITYGRSNLTQIYVEASIAFINHFYHL